ncbi:hypothetical protein T552_02767 [Pneumocystis carinii B80]|uniref:GIT Spa2 homology (SHD) domain-containing protein n=1 Tax=Pneumocystis carinii (strain B80) TaxID=1408658 RepID=A0A0W4ZEI5_PNEC8|nr:hypothetical protein T552_02767 [Pneumocystis carinii B80]KTW26766.1 hypothetical protein T552_02767 [Pneumocystis carinii B80]
MVYQSSRINTYERSMVNHLEEKTNIIYHAAFKQFLKSNVRNEADSRNTKAREKLTYLSKQQFYELSTDVYDELIRRQTKNLDTTFLQPCESFHPKRNQARQKLSTLSILRFLDLLGDVSFELERRFPELAENSTASKCNEVYAEPCIQTSEPTNMLLNSGLLVPKTFHPDTIIPNKSVMIEEGSDAEISPIKASGSSSSFRLDAAASQELSRSLDKKTEDYNLRLKEINYHENIISCKKQTINDKTESIDNTLKNEPTADYEHRIITLQNKIFFFESQLNIVNAKLAESEQELSLIKKTYEKNVEDEIQLRKKLEINLKELQQSNKNLNEEIQILNKKQDTLNKNNEKYQLLLLSYEKLKSEMEEQQRVTNEVKREAREFLKEMKSLSEKETSSWQQIETLSQQVSFLQDEVKEWKNQYSKVKSQLLGLKATSYTQPLKFKANYENCIEEHGVISNIAITNFQIAIDDLLHAGRSSEHKSVLEAMKDVIVSIKSINMNLEDNKHKSIFDDPQKSSAIAKLKSRMSATTNNLMIASKNHALNKGLGPVSLLDAAAFHLTATVIELVKLVKLRPSTPADSQEELNDNFDNIKELPIDLSLTQTNLDAPEDKTPEILSNDADIPDICSTNTDTSKMPKTSVLKAVIDSDFDNNLDDFKIFLETKTEDIVELIQAFLSSIRADAQIKKLKDHMTKITNIVQSLVSKTFQVIAIENDENLREKISTIINGLINCCSRSEELLGDKIENINIDKSFKQKLAGIAFDIAKQTKELLRTINGNNENA